MKISQIFGPTIQGEGAAAGRHCVFVRTYNCNLSCTWCDTAYTWADTPERAAKTQSGIQYDRYDPAYGLKEMDLDTVLKKIDELWNYKEYPTIVVISGGEPMIQQVDLTHLGRALRNWSNEIHIETAGTIAPTYEFDRVVTQYNVSPKLESSGNRKEMRYRPEVLRLLNGTGKAWFKFVVTPETLGPDFDEIDLIVNDCHIPRRRVMIMPEGSKTEKNIATAQLFADRAICRGYGVTFRSHVLLWGDDKDK
jgi:organic radical activating enzyme